MTGFFAVKSIPSEFGIKDEISSPVVAESFFLGLYPNRIQAILRPPGCKSWTTVSKHFAASDSHLTNAVAGKDTSIWGLRWGKQTRFAVLDVDAGSKYHNAQELNKLQNHLATVKLISTLYRSSESEGWHFYLFLDDWHQSDELEETLKSWLRANGYEIKNGVLEVFPSKNGLRLPMQSGFAWLDASGQVIVSREDLTADEAIMRFSQDALSRVSDWQQSKCLMLSQLERKNSSCPGGAAAHAEAIKNEGFEHLFNYKLIKENFQKGRDYWQTGLTASGQRHDAIICVEHYLWHGDPANDVPALPGDKFDETRYRLIRAWLEKNHNGMCRHINRGKWARIETQIKRAVKWRRAPESMPQVREPYPMTERAIEVLIARYKQTGRIWTMDDLKKGNDGREQNAREKITQAVKLLQSQGRRVTGRQISRLSGCNHHTIRKHFDIWKIYSPAASPSVASDLNSVLGPGGAALSGFENSEKESLDLLEPVCSDELAPIDLTPPFLLPGFQPTAELPVSSPSPSGSFRRLDTGSQVQRNPGKAANDAGGLEPATENCFSFSLHLVTASLSQNQLQNAWQRFVRNWAICCLTSKAKPNLVSLFCSDAPSFNVVYFPVLRAGCKARAPPKS